MRERVSVFTGAHQGMPWLGTFHSIGVKILRMHAELVGLQAELHHPRYRRPASAAQAGPAGREPGRQALAGPRARQPDRRLEEPRPRSRACPGERIRVLRRRTRRGALRRLPGAAEDAERRRLRRPAARSAETLPRASRRARRLSAPVPLHPGRRVPGHQRRPVSVAPAAGAGRRQYLLRRRRRPVDLRLARRRRRQHPAVRDGLSRREGHPARAQLPLGRPHPGGRLGADRPQPGPPRQDPVHRRADGRTADRHRRLGQPGGSARRRRGDRSRRSGTGSRSTMWRSSCAPRSRCASSRSASSPWACRTK